MTAHGGPRTQDEIDEQRFLRPSEVMDRFWVWAVRLKGRTYPEPTERSGKWLIFVAAVKLKQIATLDHRHFSVVRPAHVEAFELLP